MTRSAKLLLALALAAVAIPGVSSAQQAQAPEPKDNKWTKDATKFMTVAGLKQKPEEQAPLYQQALASLQQGMQKEPQNAKLWLLEGEIYAQLGQYASADTALKKAQELYPTYAQEIEGAREQAWLKEFQKGTQALDRNQSDSAIAFMKAAESIYSARPEAQLNLGVIYLNSGKPPEALAAFKLAKERLNGPLTAKLKPEDQAQWKSWDQLIDVTTAQVEGNKGIEFFQKEQFDSSAAQFQKALQINPRGRDYAFNYAESIFARTNKLEEQRRDAENAKPPKKDVMKQLDQQLVPMYQQLIDAAQKVLPFDPANTDSYIMIAKSYRGESVAATTPADQKAFQDKALEALTTAQKLPFEVTEVSAQFGENSKLSGKIKNHTLKPGEPAKIKVSFVALDGSVLGSADVNVAAGAADSTVPFEASAPTKGQVAGWKYEMVP